MSNENKPKTTPSGSVSKKPESEGLRKLREAGSWESYNEYLDRKLTGVNTGLPLLDRALLGLPDLTVIQGCPGVCKSTLALQVGHYNMLQGGTLYYLDRENNREELRIRLVAQSYPCSRNTQKTASEARRRELASKVDATRYYYDYLDVEPDEAIATLRKNLDDLAAHAEGPIIVVVDSVQALPDLADKRLETIQRWMREFDMLKLRHAGKITFILVSEKSRGTYREANIAGAKESGAIEYKGELVLDLREGAGQTVICEVVKNRHGRRGLVFELSQVLVDATNPDSFCYKLRAKEYRNE